MNQASVSNGDQARAWMVFLLGGKRYAVPADRLIESVRLPELTPVDDEPAYIAGVINVRGRVAPVMDLNLRMGRRSRPYRLSDCVLLLDIDGALLGVLAEELVKLRAFSHQDFGDLAHFESLETESRHRLGHCVRAVARDGDELVLLLDERVLFSAAWPTEAAEVMDGQWDESAEELPEPGRFRTDANERELEIFRQRKLRLMERLESDDARDHLPLALVRLGGELAALEVELVRGFARVRSITPVPCCPEFIVGNVNLRGEILTVVDLRMILRLPELGTNGEAKDDGIRQIMIVESGSVTAGVLVEDVVDVILLDPRRITRAPLAGAALNEEYVKGTALYEGQVISLVNLKNVFDADGLTGGV